LRVSLENAAGWEGAFTHFLDAESDGAGTERQWNRFQETLNSLPRRPALVHAANSAAALGGKGYAGDLVRPGIFLYGGAVGSAQPRPVAALRARVIATRSIAQGDTVGYATAWRAEQPCIVATLAVGYADGLPRSAGPQGVGPREIELDRKLVPLLGRVTMDMCMVRVPQDVAIGDIATVYGGMISIDRQAEAAGTISYELLTRLGPRLPRCYSRSG
jgi:alanine racemase